MKKEETIRCRNIRRVLIGMFIVCGYLLSTTFATAYIDVDGKEQLISMTALNLAFGSMGADHPVYKNTLFGVTYMVIPLLGFLFMFFDHRSNVKNLVGIACGMIGCCSIALPIGMSGELGLGIGALLSMLIYLIITPISAISVFMKIEDDRKASGTLTS